MTIKQLAENCSFNIVCSPEAEREIDGCYMGDLLSWVMGRAEADNIWITIMTNSNILAVAALADVACILLAEGVELDDELIKVGEEKCINILSTELPQYEAAIAVSKALNA